MKLCPCVSLLTLLLVTSGQSFATSFSQAPVSPSLVAENIDFRINPNTGRGLTNDLSSAETAEALRGDVSEGDQFSLSSGNDGLFSAILAIPEPVAWICVAISLLGLAAVRMHPRRTPRSS